MHFGFEMSGNSKMGEYQALFLLTKEM